MSSPETLAGVGPSPSGGRGGDDGQPGDPNPAAEPLYRSQAELEPSAEDRDEQGEAEGEGDVRRRGTCRVLTNRRNTDALLELVNEQSIEECPRYLLAGTVLGMLGFLVAVIPYVMRITEARMHNEIIELEEVPATVSELVSKWDTVEARIFFGFELTAANCILLSWYPFKLRSTCCIPASGGCRIWLGHHCSISWASFRQFMPPIGLVLVACCPTVTIGTRVKPSDLVLISVHCAAAMMMFIGFLMAEAHALSTPIIFTSLRPFECRRPTIDQGCLQWKLRSATWYVAAACFSSFLIMQVVIFLATEKKRRYNVSSFLLEVIAGLSMLGNHGVIWYFSPERLWSQRGVVGDWEHAAVQPVEVELQALRDPRKELPSGAPLPRSPRATEEAA